MKTETASGKTQPVVLMVDDEAVARTLLEYYVRKTGHRAIVAESAAMARRLVGELGPAAIDCVITDYNMPGESGLELLLWIKQNDPALSVIIITATTERETVAATLRGGASDFLDKPITEAKLAAALHAGIAATAHQRRLAETDRAVRQVGQAQHQMFGLGPEAAANLEVCYHPCHAAGGDFINYFQLDPDRYLAVVGDVSGHDLHAAFVSAYFQGLLRGMIEGGRAVSVMLESFNRFLLEEWGFRAPTAGPPDMKSVCVAAVLVDQARREIYLSSHGIPQSCAIDATGVISRRDDAITGPLGWFSDLKVIAHRSPTPPGGRLLIWTDGLEDLAETLDVTPCSLATALLRARQRGAALPELVRAQDDILIVSLQLEGAGNRSSWLPVLQEHYHGGQGDEIDRLQARWERSVQLALPDLSEARRYDLLLAMREVVINALRHGCAGQPDQSCQVMVAVESDRQIIHCVITDTGPGHAYDWTNQPPTDELADLHRGLALVHWLATSVTTTRQGAELALDFNY